MMMKQAVQAIICPLMVMMMIMIHETYQLKLTTYDFIRPRRSKAYRVWGAYNRTEQYKKLKEIKTLQQYSITTNNYASNITKDYI